MWAKALTFAQADNFDKADCFQNAFAVAEALVVIVVAVLDKSNETSALVRPAACPPVLTLFARCWSHRDGGGDLDTRELAPSARRSHHWSQIVE